MISTILLIAFTVAVGGIISVWLTGFTRTATGGTESRTEALSHCSASGFEVISVKTTDNYTYITHYGQNVKIYPISVVFSDGTTVSSASFRSGTNYTVNTGEIALINLTGIFPSGATSLRVNALCEYGGVNISSPIVAECRKGDKCWS
jgi:FlaG/FlaF family flagellin (archaellin)